MQSEVSFKTAFCSDYENLLKNCQKALEEWNERGAQLTASGMVEKSNGQELRILQSRFIKAYDLLQGHTHDCELCLYVSEIATRQQGSYSANTAAVVVH